MMYGWIIGIILVVVFIVALSKGQTFQRSRGLNVDSETNTSAMEILKNRYAKGEIDEAEFEKKKAELEKPN